MNIKTLNVKKAREILNLPEDHIVFPHAVVNTVRGLATICHEGVGWFEGSDGYTVLCAGEWDVYHKELTKDQLQDLIIDEGDMTLEKLISPHNDRTRSNLWIWENEIKDISQNVVGSV